MCAEISGSIEENPIIPYVKVGEPNWELFPRQLFVDTTNFVRDFTLNPQANQVFDLFEKTKRAEASAVLGSANRLRTHFENSKMVESGEIDSDDSRAIVWEGLTKRNLDESTKKLTDLHEKLREIFTEHPEFEEPYNELEEILVQMVIQGLTLYSPDEQRTPGISAIMQSDMLKLLSINIDTLTKQK